MNWNNSQNIFSFNNSRTYPQKALLIPSFRTSVMYYYTRRITHCCLLSLLFSTCYTITPHMLHQKGLLFERKHHDSDIDKGGITGKLLVRTGKCIPIRWMNMNCFAVYMRETAVGQCHTISSLMARLQITMKPLETLPKALETLATSSGNDLQQ